MTTTHKSILVLGILALVVVLVGSQNASASAPSGLPAIIATSTNPAVGTTAAVIFATSSTCSARIITTENSPIMLTFSDYNGATPSGFFGHWQPASTTVAYDSGLYGCGLVKAYSYTSQFLTVSESR